MVQRHILLTGGAGYIGSHTYLALVDAGHDVTILDNFSNARRSVIDRLARITGARCDVIDADVGTPNRPRRRLRQGPFRRRRAFRSAQGRLRKRGETARLFRREYRRAHDASAHHGYP
jgi:nucleoside-diphosphate-sugar epimerase